MTKSLPQIYFFISALLVIALCLALPKPALADNNHHHDNDDDVRVTFYIAVGGATCAGLAWYIAYRSGFVSEDLFRKPALVNYQEREGWSMGAPIPRLNNAPDQGDTYLELVRIQFD